MLTHVAIKNFRCLEEVDVPLGPLTAIVGPNGVGKTTLLRAIELVLGNSWPTLRSFRTPQDAAVRSLDCAGPAYAKTGVVVSAAADRALRG